MPLNIDYTTIDFDALKDELITYLKETKSFKDANFVSSNIRTLVELYAYLGSLFGYYINSIANEPFLPSAKRYKNLNRIARLLAYSPRGDKASTLNLIGYLTPEYCFGKEDSYFEIPAYSLFPSNKKTPDGQNFSFTNIDQVVYSVKSFGIRTVDQTDFSYDGLQLPLTKSVDFWTQGTTATPSFDSGLLSLNLSDTLPLSVLKRDESDNYKSFDVESVPLFDSSDASSIGQPFNRTIFANRTNIRIKPETTYFIVFTFDKQTSTPYLELLEDGVKLDEKRTDIITSIRLEPTDENNTFYTLKEIQNNAKGRFYLGVLGMKNLDSVEFDFDKLESTVNGIKQIHLNINKSGDKAPFQVLVDGTVYTFKSGTISSQIFDLNTWDPNQPFYNINLNIITPTEPDFNYDATLTLESTDPGINSVTIAKIYPTYVDPVTNIKAIGKDSGQKYGNLQSVPKSDVTTTEQKSGVVSFSEGVNKIFVPFDTEFVKLDANEEVDYILQLTPTENIQVWFSDKSEIGFSINVESNAGFSGSVNWIATRYKESETRVQNVSFDEPIPQVAGEDADYTIFLTPSDNVRTWFTDKTSTGFKINIEKSFSGTVSYSTFVFSDDEQVLAERNAATQRKGRVTLTNTSRVRTILFDEEFQDNNYGLHMIANKNVNVWYTNKTSTGFDVNVEEGFDGQVSIEWFADFSPEYQFQKHGTVNFSGQLTTAGSIPGIRFNNISESFLIDDLKQGLVKFSYINRNGNIERANNNLGLKFTADRTNIRQIKFEVTEPSISYADIRVFVSNSSGEWEEWEDATSFSNITEAKVGSKVFFVRVNEYKKIEVYFGDGKTFGVDPYGNDIYVFGLKTVGNDGNIPANSIGRSVILSQNILGDDNITTQFNQQFIQLVGLKSQTFFSADEPTSPTVIYDSDGTKITDNELTIKQPTPAFGGEFVETVEELRSNASSAIVRQDRIVSKDDYKTFCNQAFYDYIIKTQILSYEDLQESGLLPQNQLEKYWFNYIFIVALPKFGNEIPKKHRDYILSTLDERVKSMTSVEHELISAKLIPIDVRIRYKKTKLSGSNESIETMIRNIVRDYFSRDKREMGETIEYGPLAKQILNIPFIQNAELAMNKDPDNKFGANDYDIDAQTLSNETVEEVKRREVLKILAKDPNLLKVLDPLFDVTDSKTGERKWVFSQNIDLNKFEFPIIGDIIIELEG